MVAVGRSQGTVGFHIEVVSELHPNELLLGALGIDLFTIETIVALDLN